ncbi:pyocin knob domain-containing protein [Paenibacillus campinasensis]|uniref:pyocin knob domain-containing protein n=1 Tax=Paenibacillus campinasensis TaxID=66347 RepID=UPI001C52E78A|nr:pyocin knob domain-containing protein [Paenibacillus campinasensis]
MAQTPNLGLPLIDENMTADVPRDMNALANAVDTAVKDAVDGVTVPDASTTQKGVVQLNDTVTSTNKTQAGTADAVRRAYDRGTEGVNAAAAAQAKADAAETPAGAQAKANAAETNAKNYVDGKTWQKQRLTTDSGASLILAAGTNLNNIRTTGFYDGTGLINAPGNGWYYIEVQSHSSNPGAWTIQKAHDFNNNTYYQRTCTNGTWSAWQELFQSVANGKNAVASAISGKGVPASGSDDFAVLANKISQIKTGIQVATGTVPNTVGPRTISNLPFKPQILMVYGRAQTLTSSNGYRAEAYGYVIAYNTNGTTNIGSNLSAFLYGYGFEQERNIQTLTNVVFGTNSVSFDGVNGTGGTTTSYIVFGV